MTIPIDSSWTLTFDEEFNGNKLDTNVWGDNWLGNPGTITKPVNGEELSAYDPAQVSVSDGLLHLKAIQSPVTVNGKTYQYRSGLINTHESFNQTYGYFEARINCEGSNGDIDNWPAFWLDGENWPEDGELDVMEGLGGTAAYHFHSPSGGPGKGVSGDFTGWHTYGALWEPGKVSFYYDNVLVGTITSGITDSPMYIILNLGLGVNSILNVPSEMQVDWVHAYSIDPNAEAVDPQSGYNGPGGNSPTGSVINGTDSADTLVGTTGADVISGLDGRDSLTGLGGNDQIWGESLGDSADGGDGNDLIDGGRGLDNLLGGAGADTLNGGFCGDRLTGGSGADTFVYTMARESKVDRFDVITDFHHSEGDLISLAAIDAKASAPGDQEFNFIGTGAFTHHAGELRYQVQGSDIFVSGDTNGDGIADFGILLQGVSTITAADFIL